MRNVFVQLFLDASISPGCHPVAVLLWDIGWFLFVRHTTPIDPSVTQSDLRIAELGCHVQNDIRLCSKHFPNSLLTLLRKNGLITTWASMDMADTFRANMDFVISKNRAEKDAVKHYPTPNHNHDAHYPSNPKIPS
jgi:hypothetical protein